MVPMSITSCTQEVFNRFLDEDIAKGFFHAHTYSANPIGCAAAIAGIELLTSERMQENVQRIAASHQTFSEKIKDHPKVAYVRSKGVIFAVDLNMEMERYGELRNKLFEHFMSKGVFLRPLGNTIYVLPPYVITQNELQKVYTAIEEVLTLV